LSPCPHCLLKRSRPSLRLGLGAQASTPLGHLFSEVSSTFARHPRDALRYNPARPMLVLAAVAVLLRAAVGQATGYFLSVHVPRRLLIPVMVVALVALEVNQQLHAGLLTQPWLGA
jgi:hypothetical protein